MGNINIDQTEKAAEGDHIAEDHLTKLLNPHHPEWNLLIRAEARLTDRLLGNELIPFCMKPYQNIRLIDHWIFNPVPVIGEITTDSLIPDGGVIIEEKGDLITQFLQHHGEDMGNDPDRLASYACKDDSFH
jgi:hypothetical protein